MLAALVGGTAALFLTQFQFSIWLESAESDPDSPPIIEVDAPHEPAVAASPPPTPPRQLPTASPDALRVSNQTSHPIRVVLRLGQRDNAVNANENTAGPDLPLPIHWDFAPQEGSQTGLLLSLPTGDLRLKQGDVLMAFALDGSRRYWGPYVVGDTNEPIQDSSSLEWTLVLEP